MFKLLFNTVQAEATGGAHGAGAPPHLWTFPSGYDAWPRCGGEHRSFDLRPRSLAMLRYLVEHPGRLVTKAELRQHVWAGTHVTDTVLRVSCAGDSGGVGRLGGGAAVSRNGGTAGLSVSRGR